MADGIPAGISTALVHLDAPISFIGAVGRIHATVAPSIPLVWAATGTPVGNFIDNISLDVGVELAIDLPHTDQAGFLDGNGNSITGWYYTIEITYERNGQNIPFPTRDFQILSGQAEVDLALIPTGQASPAPQVAPILPVTSIDGLTGEVTLSGLGLNLVDNTSDADKPVSTAQVTAFERSTIPSWVTRPGRFNPENSTYNLSPRTLPRWGAALARAAAGGAHAHVIVGADSIGRGSGASLPYTTGSWPGQMFSAFKKVWGDPGGLGWNTFNDEASVTADPLTVITGFTRDGGRGLHQEARTSTAAGQTIVYGPHTCTKFRIKYTIRTDGGQFTWKVNAGGTTTVDTVGGVESIGTVTIAASTNPGLNTLTITSLGANVTILATEAVSTDTGSIKVTRGARNGAKIGNFIYTTNPATGALALWKDLAPDLLVLALETNDFDQQTTLATYRSQIETAITSARSVNADVLLVATIPPDVTEVIPLSDYTAVLYSLADQYDLPLLDMQHRWGSFAASNAAPFSLYNDTLHPSPKGHSDYARAVFEAIGDSWRQSAVVGLDTAQSWTQNQTFGYKGNANEQVRVGGMDNGVTDITTAVSPYVLAASSGALYLSSKSGQQLSIFSDINMQAKSFVPVNGANAAVRAKGAVEIDKVAAPTGNPAGAGVYLFVDPADALLKQKGPTGVISEVMTSKGAVLVSPNGTRYSLTVGDDGALTTTSL